MKKIIPILFLSMTSIILAENRKIIGTVTDGTVPIEEVLIKILDKDREVMTTDNGKYEIMADAGDILEYTHPAMKTIRIRVEDVTRVLNIKMYYDAEQLDEVVLTEKLKERSYSKYL